jgi:hypothetical protein
MGEKTVGPETFQAPEERPAPETKHYVLNREFRPAPGADIVAQDTLRELADAQDLLEHMTEEVKARKDEIVERLRGGAVVEPGAYAAAVKTNWKAKRVDWHAAFIDYQGDVEAAKLEGVAKSGPKEISSYSLDMKRVSG